MRRRGRLALALAVALGWPAAGAGDEWIDPDTPADRRVLTRAGVRHALVFSDEFNVDGRTFADGHDPVWTALRAPSLSALQINVYNDSLAYTTGGRLVLETTAQDWTARPDGDGDALARSYQAALLQSWNKFCFTGGVLEVSARLPGLAGVAGLAPTFSLLGNLARAGLAGSAPGISPFSFDECPRSDGDRRASQLGAQELGRCGRERGRGAPQLDVFHALPGDRAVDYAARIAAGRCGVASADVVARASARLPQLLSTVFVAPGLPAGSRERPSAGCLPTATQGYPELFPSAAAYARGVYADPARSNSSLAYEFYGAETEVDGVALATDALSVGTELARTHFETQHRYQCDWRPGADGRVTFLLDDAPTFALDAAVLAAPRAVSFVDGGAGTLRPRLLPDEAMSMVLSVDVDLGPQLGLPPCPPSCDCCLDCKLSRCTSCVVVGEDGVATNARQWLADLCATLPAKLEVDYIRIYQPEGAEAVGCDPPDLPTAALIGARAERYTQEGDRAPLRPVLAGGGACDARAERPCGAQGRCVLGPRGPSRPGACACELGWTGPRCLARAAGDSLACQGLSYAALDDEAEPRVGEAPCLSRAGATEPELAQLVDAQCAYAGNGSALARGACVDVAAGGRFARCTARQRANHVLDAWQLERRGFECCADLLRLSVCAPRTDRVAWYQAFLAGVVVLGVCVAPLLRAQSRRALARHAYALYDALLARQYARLRARPPRARADPAVVAAAEQALRSSTTAPRKRLSLRAQATLATLFDELTGLFGFQTDSCQNQHEHLAQLWGAHTAACGDERLAARLLHEAMFESFERWLDASAGLISLERASRIVFIQYRAPSHAQRLREMALFLCLWGEASNVRFCPEVLCFYFECARHYKPQERARVDRGVGTGEATAREAPSTAARRSDASADAASLGRSERTDRTAGAHTVASSAPARAPRASPRAERATAAAEEQRSLELEASTEFESREPARRHPADILLVQTGGAARLDGGGVAERSRAGGGLMRRLSEVMEPAPRTAARTLIVPLAERSLLDASSPRATSPRVRQPNFDSEPPQSVRWRDDDDEPAADDDDDDDDAAPAGWSRARAIVALTQLQQASAAERADEAGGEWDRTYAVVSLLELRKLADDFERHGDDGAALAEWDQTWAALATAELQKLVAANEPPEPREGDMRARVDRLADGAGVDADATAAPAADALDSPRAPLGDVAWQRLWAVTTLLELQRALVDSASADASSSDDDGDYAADAWTTAHKGPPPPPPPLPPLDLSRRAPVATGPATGNRGDLSRTSTLFSRMMSPRSTLESEGGALTDWEAKSRAKSTCRTGLSLTDWAASSKPPTTARGSSELSLGDWDAQSKRRADTRRSERSLGGGGAARPDVGKSQTDTDRTGFSLGSWEAKSKQRAAEAAEGGASARPPIVGRPVEPPSAPPRPLSNLRAARVSIEERARGSRAPPPAQLHLPPIRLAHVPQSARLSEVSMDVDPGWEQLVKQPAVAAVRSTPLVSAMRGGRGEASARRPQRVSLLAGCAAAAQPAAQPSLPTVRTRLGGSLVRAGSTVRAGGRTDRSAAGPRSASAGSATARSVARGASAEADAADARGGYRYLQPPYVRRSEPSSELPLRRARQRHRAVPALASLHCALGERPADARAAATDGAAVGDRAVRLDALVAFAHVVATDEADMPAETPSDRAVAMAALDELLARAVAEPAAGDAPVDERERLWALLAVPELRALVADDSLGAPSAMLTARVWDEPWAIAAVAALERAQRSGAHVAAPTDAVRLSLISTRDAYGQGYARSSGGLSDEEDGAEEEAAEAEASDERRPLVPRVPPLLLPRPNASGARRGGVGVAIAATQPRDTAGLATCNRRFAPADEPDPSAPRPAGAYMRNYVSPLYRFLFACNFEGYHPKSGVPYERPIAIDQSRLNYDDVNEMFWTPDRIRSIVTHDGVRIIELPASQRWAALAHTDWNRSLAACKRHYEVHSWHCLFAAYARITIYHMITFYMALLIALAVFASGPWQDVVDSLVVYAGFAAPALVQLCADLCETRITPGVTLLSTLREYDKTGLYLVQIALLGLLYANPDSQIVLTLYLGASAVVLGRVTFVASSPGQRLESFDSNVHSLPGTVVPMVTFWALVLFAKGLVEMVVILRAVAEACVQLEIAQPLIQIFGSAELLAQVFHVRALLVRALQQLLLLLAAFVVHATSTYYWYILGITLVGTFRGFHVQRLQGARPAARAASLRAIRDLPGAFVAQVFAYDAPELERGVALARAHRAGAQSWARELPPDVERAWAKIWNAICVSMFEQDTIGLVDLRALRYEGVDDEGLPGAPARPLIRPMLFGARSSSDKLLPRGQEFRRRVLFLINSLKMRLPRPAPVEGMPSFTVLIPHYGESIILSERELFDKEKQPTGVSDKSQPLIALLTEYFPDELGAFRGRIGEQQWALTWTTVAARFAASGEAEAATRVRRLTSESRAPFGRADETAHEAAIRERVALLALRKWASMRMQTLYRTVRGMMYYERALDLLLQTQRPELTRKQRLQVVGVKFQCLVSMQRYAYFDAEMLTATEVLLAEFPRLNIAYIDEVPDALAPGGRRYFSCLFDASSEIGPDMRRKPRLRVELPGYCILGDGKGDNQNHALIFARGRFLQTIDANQDGYLEEALKICNALAEFRDEPTATRARISIVGFREHVYSSLGSIANFSAASELVFGTMMQRVMDRPLVSRQYYGHPDIMEKLTMISQGGVSKATRGLNLSEDIFAGMDMMLRGGNVIHREYFQVGKGREMSLGGQLKFISKLSRGCAEMTLTRQSHRLGTRLSFVRMLGFFYGHVGFYMTPMLMDLSVWLLLYLQLFFVLCDVEFRSTRAGAISYAQVASGVLDAQFGPIGLLFVFAQALPLFFESAIYRGPLYALRQIAQQFATLSLVFFSFQAQYVGYTFRKEVARSDAAYIATGRSIATQRTPFVELYRSFAASNIQPGIEVGVMAALVLAARPEVLPRVGFWVMSTVVMLSWVFCPSVFNPQMFRPLSILRGDVLVWLRWVVAEGKGGWLDWSEAELAKSSDRPYSQFILPGRHVLATATLVILVRQTLRLNADTFAALLWESAELVQLGVPLVPLLLVALLAAAMRRSARARPYAIVACALLLALYHVLELGLLAVYGSMRGAFVEFRLDVRPTPTLSRQQLVVLAAFKYFALRAATSGFAWLTPDPPPDDRYAVEAERGAREPLARAAKRAARDLVLAYFLLADTFALLFTLTPLFVISLLPGVRKLHTLLIFRVLPPKQIDEAAEKRSSKRRGSADDRPIEGLQRRDSLGERGTIQKEKGGVTRRFAAVNQEVGHNRFGLMATFRASPAPDASAQKGRPSRASCVLAGPANARPRATESPLAGRLHDPRAAAPIRPVDSWDAPAAAADGADAPAADGRDGARAPADAREEEEGVRRPRMPRGSSFSGRRASISEDATELLAA